VKYVVAGCIISKVLDNEEVNVFDNIIVPLDGSSNAEIVLPYVAAIGSSFGSEIMLVTATESATSDESLFSKEYLKHVSEGLKAIIQQRQNLVISTDVITGKPADVILKLANRKKANLIIIAAHGASGGDQQLTGSIATKILSGSDTPVLLIKTKEGDATTPEDLIKRILVPLDGSHISEISLKIVEPLATRFNAEIILFQSVEPMRYISSFETMVPNIVLPSDDEIKQSAAKYLSEIQTRLKQRGITVSSAIIASSPAEAIIDYADSGNISVVAMTTHGFSGIKRWVFGSTTNKVMQAGRKPLLMIPIPKN
jgi:nucleotide-binding universal stress UspA family protein